MTLSSISLDAWLTVITLGVLVIALVRDWASPDLCLLSAVVALTALGVITVGEALSGFSNAAVLAVGALFVLAEAISRSGAFAFLYPLMIPRSSNPRTAMLRLMLPTSALSAFTNNTPLVAVLTPLVQQWSGSANIAASKLLMPMAFATTLGGLVTLLGTSTNLVVSGLLAESGHQPFTVWELAAVGVPLAITGVAYFVLFGQRVLPDRGVGPGREPRSVRPYHFELRVPPGSPLAGKTVEESELRALEGAFLAHLRRRGDIIGPVAPSQLLQPDDVLAFVGNPDVLNDLLVRGELVRAVDLPRRAEEPDLPLFEAVIAADSTLVGSTLRDADFRERFNAVVLGIHRGGKRLTDSIGRTELEAGDLLLIEARSNFAAQAHASGEFSLTAPLERHEPKKTRRAAMVLVTLVAMIAAVTAGAIDLSIAAIAAALIVIGFGAISAIEARRSINVTVLIVMASGLALGHAVEKTRLAAALANDVIGIVQPFGVIGALAAIYVLTNVMTEFLSNTAAAVLVFPVALSAAEQVGASPHAFAIAVAVAASAAFAAPIGYQTHLMIMGPGGYRFTDYVRVGLPLNILCAIVAIPIIAAVWL